LLLYYGPLAKQCVIVFGVVDTYPINLRKKIIIIFLDNPGAMGKLEEPAAGGWASERLHFAAKSLLTEVLPR
jgi:hypothetical protein